jgi:hypothetical protein
LYENFILQALFQSTSHLHEKRRRIRIWKAQKHADAVPDPDPQHCKNWDIFPHFGKFWKKWGAMIANEEFFVVRKELREFSVIHNEVVLIYDSQSILFSFKTICWL